MPSHKLSLALALAGAALLGGCSDSSDRRPGTTPPPVEPPEPAEAVGYDATVHFTEGGFPHIVAEDFGSLGFGTGYASAMHNTCLLAENILQVRGQLSEYLGPDHANTDAFTHYMIQNGRFDVEVSPEMDYLYAGFAAGYNHYLRETGVDNISDPACQGANWVLPMTAEDVKRSELNPAFLPRLASLFLAATPPASVAKNEKAPATDNPAAEKQQLAPAPKPEPMPEAEQMMLAATITDMASARDKGSNGLAIGSDLTDHSGGILYTNPHVDWTDFNFRFMSRHQIIPGVTNLLGSNAFNRVMMGFGTNGDVAWTNTVSPSRTQALYELELVPGNPMAYLFDGQEETIESINVSFKVLDEDGNLNEETRTLYQTRHGLIMGLLFAWDDQQAFALRVADEGNRGQNGQILANIRATSVQDILDAGNKYAASANTTTIAADRHGEALYGDLGPVANLSDQQLEDCATDTPVLISFFAPAFRGNTSDCEWMTDEDSAADGLVGASNQPYLMRSDYVVNSNDSYWLVNHEETIEGIPAVMGDTEDERTLRTRSGMRMVQERVDGSDGLGGNSFNIDNVVTMALSNQNHAGQLLRDGIVTLCEANPSVELDGETVDISAACPVLAAWDLHSDLDSRGAHLFREIMRSGGGSRWLPEDYNFTVAFDIEDPVHTPRGLDTENNPAVLEDLATAVKVLDDAGIALDARLGDIQSATKNGERIPMHGGEEFEGVFNKMSYDFAGSDGYPDVTGSSATWVMAVEFADAGLKAKGNLTYSMSGNPNSPNSSDMTEAFARKELLDLPYELADVEAAALSTVELSEGTTDCAGDGWQDFPELAFENEDACRSYFTDLEANQLKDWVDS